MRRLSIIEVKKIELDILAFLHTICMENGLRYYLAFGSALGAVRHAGFIPWDDDIDVFMPQVDLDRFIEITSQTASEYKLISPSTGEYKYVFSKLVNTTTIVKQTDIEEIPNLGVWVDIFPLCGYRNTLFLRTLMMLLDKSRALSLYNKSPRKSNILLNILIYCYWNICKLIGADFFCKKLFHLVNRVNFDDSDVVFALETIVQYGGLFNKKTFGKGKMMSFENLTVFVPDKVEEYLKCTYGDYMILPPIEKRTTHNINAYKK